MIESTDRAEALLDALDRAETYAPNTNSLDLLDRRDRALSGALPVLVDLARAARTEDGDARLARLMLRGVRTFIPAARRDLAYSDVLARRDPDRAGRLRRTHSRTRSAARLVAFWEEIGGDELPLSDDREGKTDDD